MNPDSPVTTEGLVVVRISLMPTNDVGLDEHVAAHEGERLESVDRRDGQSSARQTVLQ